MKEEEKLKKDKDLNWQIPELIGLTSVERVDGGEPCSTGSGATGEGCWNGNGAFGTCNSGPGVN